VLKGCGLAELEVAVRAVARGQTYLTPAVSHHVVDGYLRREDDRPVGLDPLTVRQREVLQLIAEGHTANEIAGKLHLSPRTVDSHRTALMRVLDIHDKATLVRVAMRMGVIGAEG